VELTAAWYRDKTTARHLFQYQKWITCLSSLQKHRRYKANGKKKKTKITLWQGEKHPCCLAESNPSLLCVSSLPQDHSPAEPLTGHSLWMAIKWGRQLIWSIMVGPMLAFSPRIFISCDRRASGNVKRPLRIWASGHGGTYLSLVNHHVDIFEELGLRCWRHIQTWHFAFLFEHRASVDPGHVLSWICTRLRVWHRSFQLYQGWGSSVTSSGHPSVSDSARGRKKRRCCPLCCLKHPRGKRGGGGRKVSAPRLRALPSPLQGQPTSTASPRRWPMQYRQPCERKKKS